MRSIMLVSWALYFAASMPPPDGPPIYWLALVCSLGGVSTSFMLATARGRRSDRTLLAIQAISTVGLVVLHALVWVRRYSYLKSRGEISPVQEMVAISSSVFKAELSKGLWWSAFQGVILEYLPLVILALLVWQFGSMFRHKKSRT